MGTIMGDFIMGSARGFHSPFFALSTIAERVVHCQKGSILF